MDEVTGPIVAVGLVLSRRFRALHFIGGITGQFFRQFAVTIAVSTVISAINAVTMTPSRAVLIFKTEKSGENTSTAEALPWWTFGVVGLPSGSDAESSPFLGSTASRGDRCSEDLALLGMWPSGSSPARWSAGSSAGSIIRPVNAVLGWFFRGFNRGFEADRGYGWTSARCCGCSLVVLLVYGGLLVLTYWSSRAPHRLRPAAGPGPADRDHPVARLGLAAADQGSRWRMVETIARETPGVAHTVAISACRSACRPTAQLRVDVRRPGPVRRAAGPRTERHGHHGQAAAGCAEGSRTPRSPFTARRRFPAWASPAASSSSSRTAAASGWRLAAQTDELVRQAAGQQPGLRTASTQFRSSTPQLFLDIDRTKVAALGVSFEDVNQTCRCTWARSTSTASTSSAGTGK